MYKKLTKNYLYQWILLSISILLIAGAVVHNIYLAHVDTIEGERSRLLTQARVINGNLSSSLIGTDRSLTALRDDLAALPTDRWGEDYSVRRLKLFMESISCIRTILVLDDKGVVRLSTRRELLGADLGFREYFNRARQNPTAAALYVSSPEKTLLGTWGMHLVKVITGPKARFAGVVVATLNPTYFQTLFGSVNYAPDMWATITHEDGIQYLMVPEKKQLAGNDLKQPNALFSRHMASGKESNLFIDKVNAAGDRRMIAINTVKPDQLLMDKALVVAVSRNMRAVTSEWRARLLSQALILFTISVVSATALAGFQGYQRSQLRQVDHAYTELRDARQQLHDIIDFLPDATFVLDDEKRVVIWNRAIEVMTGVSKDQMIGKGDYEYTMPFYGQRRNHLTDLLYQDNTELISQYSNIKRYGEGLGAEAFCTELNGGKGAHVWAIAKPLCNSSGRRIGVIESIRDISEQKAVQAAMQQSQEYLRKLYHGLEYSASAVLITDVTGSIEYVNRKFTQVTGYAAEEAIGKNPRILKSETTPREVFDDLWKTILSGSEWRGELQNRSKDGKVYWSVASISPLCNDQGEITHFIANVEDINERKNAEATIEHLAYYDPLTDLPNRRMLNDRLDLAMKRCRRQHSEMALMYLDIDDFKRINDILGHPAGDRLLQEIAVRYREVLRDDDVICRLGGDEFAVVLHDIQHDEDAALVANKLLAQTSRPVVIDDAEFKVTVSIGITLFPRDSEDGDILKKNADIALYQAKKEGKNTVHFFSEELNSVIRERIALDQALRKVVDKNELQLLYQPKINLEHGCVTGVEALLRWNSPDFGLVSPLRFIPLAEENRTIIQIGEWVLRTACNQQVIWQQQGFDLDMAVNLSAVQFKSPSLISQISAILDETGMNPDRLELELTESALVDKPADGARILEDLRSLGCGIAIDDFGTGYSSLSYLKTFPITVLKIDRSFVRDLAHDSGDRAIAQSIVALARNLNIVTVAEGVEYYEQQTILQELGCTNLQGFLYSRPQPGDHIPEVIEQIELQLRKPEPDNQRSIYE
ncbi:MAG: EAL domain-containing protein [Oryzomonas sp.]|uniref:bifunctional diguanylate cyclase/phosphodiesterase n=1 Tax=Oryzomonas sp. TaxID=2855186 RepID=UPI00283B2FE8|nr:EAL domain-containing protein [Oryzomonas sp.]MDR3578427.1 EAL domain-containing protein [Oryzomonas sp.]